MLPQPVPPGRIELGVSGSSVPPYAAAVVLRALPGRRCGQHGNPHQDGDRSFGYDDDPLDHHHHSAV